MDPYTVTMITTIMVALITAVFGPIIVAWVKAKFLVTKKQPNLLEEAIHHNHLVDLQLQNMLEELDCDRVWISQFHNGGHFYPTGKSIQKFSIFYEKTSLDAPSIIQTFQNIPTSLFSKAMAKMAVEGEIAIPTFDGSIDKHDVEELASKFGDKSLYFIAISDLKDQMIGTLGIAYREEHKLSKEEWIFIRQKVGAIGTLLDEYLNVAR